jgi:hypothetical protein
MVSFFKTKPTEDWRLVKTLSVDISCDRVDGKIYYHLFESNRKNRKIDLQCTLNLPSYIKLEEEARRMGVYQEKIYRWEYGRVDPEIPTYDQVPAEETVNVLKGKIS